MHYISFPNSLGGDTLVKNGEGVRRGGGGGGGGDCLQARDLHAVHKMHYKKSKILVVHESSF